MGVVLQIRGHIQRPDVKKFSAAMHRRATKVWNGAISAYIQAVAQIVALHQDTGMSYASLFPLAREVRAKGKIPPFSNRIDSRPTFIDMSGNSHSGVHKNRRLGEQAGEKCATINYGNKDYPIFTFKFEIQVYQYLMNEIGAWNPKFTPLDSMVAGQEAMNDYLETNANDIWPKFEEYFTKLSLKVY